MAFLWVLVGVGIAWFIFSFRATKATVQKAAYLEFAAFIHAIGDWNEDRTHPQTLARALDHLTVYETRRAAMRDPGGTARGSLMASYWGEALRDSGFLGTDGKPVRHEIASLDFWDSIEALRLEGQRSQLQRTFSL